MQMKNAEELYITKGIDKDKSYLIQLFLDCKLPEENLYLGKMPKSALLFEQPTSILKDIVRYFSDNIHLKYLGVNDSYTRVIENFPKLCWLTEEYFAGTLRNPIGVHYNPRLGQNVIHPGGTRQRVINLWHREDTVQAVYFNTGGKKFNWLEKLSPVDILDIVDPTVFLALVPDHGSLIPHIHYDQGLIPNNVRLYQNRINEFTKEMPRISFNVKDPFLKDYMPNARKSIPPSIFVDFKIKSPLPTSTLIRALIMIFLQYEVTSREFDIRFDGRTPRKILKI